MAAAFLVNKNSFAGVSGVSAAPFGHPRRLGGFFERWWRRQPTVECERSGGFWLRWRRWIEPCALSGRSVSLKTALGLDETKALLVVLHRRKLPQGGRGRLDRRG